MHDGKETLNLCAMTGTNTMVNDNTNSCGLWLINKT